MPNNYQKGFTKIIAGLIIIVVCALGFFVFKHTVVVPGQQLASTISLGLQTNSYSYYNSPCTRNDALNKGLLGRCEVADIIIDPVNYRITNESKVILHLTQYDPIANIKLLDLNLNIGSIGDFGGVSVTNSVRSLLSTTRGRTIAQQIFAQIKSLQSVNPNITSATISQAIQPVPVSTNNSGAVVSTNTSTVSSGGIPAYKSYGCMDSTACNYRPEATIPGGCNYKKVVTEDKDNKADVYIETWITSSNGNIIGRKLRDYVMTVDKNQANTPAYPQINACLLTTEEVANIAKMIDLLASFSLLRY